MLFKGGYDSEQLLKNCNFNYERHQQKGTLEKGVT